jgi:O-antigen ligase
MFSASNATISRPGAVFQPPTRRLAQYFGWFSRALLLIGSAVIAGTMVGQGNWLYVAVLAAAVFAMLWPIEVALGLYAFLLPFDSVSVLQQGSSGTTLNWVVGALAAMALLGTGIVKRRLNFPHGAAVLWSSLLLWSMLTAVWALEPEQARHQLPTNIALVLLYVLAVSWRVTKKQFDVLTSLAIAGGCVASLLVLYLFVTGVTYRNIHRASLLVAGQETNPDYIALLLLLPLSLSIAGFIAASGRFLKIASFSITAVIGGAIFLSMSRTALVSVAVMLVLFSIRLGLNRRILGIASALLVVLAAMPANFFSRIQQAASTGGDGRLDIWRAGLVALKQYWLTGSGLNNFWVAYRDYAGNASVFRGYSRGSHNTYLNVAVELGIIGFLLMSAALVSQLRSVRRLRAMLGELPIRVVALEAACWATLAFGFFGDILWTKPFWLNFSLLFMAVRLAEQSFEATPPRSGAVVE